MSQVVEEKLVDVLAKINKRITILERAAYLFGGYLFATAPEFIKALL